MASEEEFQAAMDRVNGRSSAPSQLDQLKLYGLFKQAKLGDASGKRPGITKMRERAKFDAWAGNKGLSQDEARSAYVKLADSLG